MLARKKKPEVTLNWHPNFRVADALPDIKQIRTGFVVNFVAITFALIAFVWMLSTEVSIHSVNKEIDRDQQGIDDKEKANKADLALSKKFAVQSKPLQFLAKFYAEKIPPLELIDAMVANRPDNILFDSIFVEPQILDLGGNKRANVQKVVFTGTLSGEAGELKGLEKFLEKTLASPVLKSRVGDPTKDYKVESKREAPGLFKFTISITLKPT